MSENAHVFNSSTLILRSRIKNIDKKLSKKWCDVSLWLIFQNFPETIIYIYTYNNCHIMKYIKTYPEVCFWILNAATDRSILKDLIHKMPSESLITLSSNENALSDVPGWFETYFIALQQGWLTHQPPSSSSHLSHATLPVRGPVCMTHERAPKV